MNASAVLAFIVARPGRTDLRRECPAPTPRVRRSHERTAIASARESDSTAATTRGTLRGRGSAIGGSCRDAPRRLLPIRGEEAFSSMASSRMEGNTQSLFDPGGEKRS